MRKRADAYDPVPELESPEPEPEAEEVEEDAPARRSAKQNSCVFSLHCWCYSSQDLVEEVWKHPQIVLEGVDIFGGELSRNACLPTPCLNGGIADPCTQRNPCVSGVCRPSGQGQYECECQDHYEGIHCDEPTLPLEVSVHPSSQIVNTNAYVELTCSFNNAKRYHWYKDDVLLPNSGNQNPLIIMSVTPSDIGYYFCRGSGRNEETLDTMRASVYVKDLTNIIVLNARFAIPFSDELHDQTSKLYKETALNISTYVEQGVRTSSGLKSLSVVCRALRPGSVKADMNIYIERTNMTATETQDLIGLSLDSLANESDDDKFDKSRILGLNKKP
ncbi:uncharacterized protein LOC115919531 [Strongylocentrotus purpuratus]|uniref:Uncharacterized protein n=1 Tax=Strongylocentrotus purpuratus TaxID=7668 RepID=A0A7M7N0F7_STRPU|nr:uncharacterized protein LOC115919531 [Strongylocentrotus purpuratus]